MERREEWLPRGLAVRGVRARGREQRPRGGAGAAGGVLARPACKTLYYVFLLGCTLCKAPFEPPSAPKTVDLFTVKIL